MSLATDPNDRSTLGLLCLTALAAVAVAAGTGSAAFLDALIDGFAGVWSGPSGAFEWITDALSRYLTF